MTLPAVLLRAAPELGADLPDEPQADCARCPMVGTFLPDIKCCTYHPTLPNYLAGRALAREDDGSEAIRDRIRADLEGVGSLGIRAPRAWDERYHRDRASHFGREASWRCPYWKPGPLNCRIWKDRNGICSTWFCKHTHGVRGHRLWTAMRKLTRHLEQQLAELAAANVPNDADRERYFLATAAWVEQLGALPEDPERDVLRARVREALVALDGPMPDVLAPLVRGVTEHDDTVSIEGYSPWNRVELPRSVFALLAACDGRRPWREAVEQARATDPTIDRTWVQALYRIDALHPPTPGADWGFEGSDLTLG